MIYQIKIWLTFMNGGLMTYKASPVRFVTWLHALVTEEPSHAIDGHMMMSNYPHRDFYTWGKRIDINSFRKVKWIGNEVFVWDDKYDNMSAGWHRVDLENPYNDPNAPHTGKLWGRMQWDKIDPNSVLGKRLDSPETKVMPDGPPSKLNKETLDVEYEIFLTKNPVWKREWGDPRKPGWKMPEGGPQTPKDPNNPHIDIHGNQFERDGGASSYRTSPLRRYVTTCAHNNTDTAAYVYTPATGFITIGGNMITNTITKHGFWYEGVIAVSGALLTPSSQISGMVLANLTFSFTKPLNDVMTFELRTVDTGTTNNPTTHVTQVSTIECTNGTISLSCMYNSRNGRTLGLYATNTGTTGNWTLRNTSFYCHFMQVM